MKHLLFDPEGECIRKYLLEIKIDLNSAATKENIPEIELQIYTIK